MARPAVVCGALAVMCGSPYLGVQWEDELPKVRFDHAQGGGGVGDGERAQLVEKRAGVTYVVQAGEEGGPVDDPARVAGEPMALVFAVVLGAMEREEAGAERVDGGADVGLAQVEVVDVDADANDGGIDVLDDREQLGGGVAEAGAGKTLDGEPDAELGGGGGE